MTEPAFVLAGPDGAVVVPAAAEHYASAAAAQDALRRGDTPIVVGALPFRPGDATALMSPATVQHSAELPRWDLGPLPAVQITAAEPDVDEHRRRVAAAVDMLRADGTAMHKVVLARALRLRAVAPLDARAVLTRLVAADPTGYGYLVDLSAAGPGYAGRALVGASPELLVTRCGQTVTARPFAGSAPRHRDPQRDRSNGAALAASGKDLHEHRLVIDAMAAVLDPLCVDLQIADTPQLSRTATLWHLSTPIRGRLRHTSTSALDLALALHPTPAVGGVPTDAAIRLIDRLEGDRGFYAGAAGWCDAGGDGRWVVSLRGAELGTDRRDVLARAGGGIVAESEPDAEVAETTAKFGAILNALSVSPP
ncbi:isochorismate synthase [Mycobacterium koreense]|uniref:isochorismate synthase n=1 Tax=Mycolicibacillus koreensis TaxID=1069220 RepID=A0A7I7SDY0_9MYCO|nr:isochorismate synthase [Mycolicibacillus koreensis]MCV7249925.1 isochorismate synthase [Mycolicibacillus koreensis]OSC34857.1 isochorismate synthase [Mycolicibacillus koreensis]BBY54720.1 isochorismate synthase [Mycolicibacillus koreensis]